MKFKCTKCGWQGDEKEIIYWLPNIGALCPKCRASDPYLQIVPGKYVGYGVDIEVPEGTKWKYFR